MKPADVLAFSLRALRRYPLRTLLMLLAMGTGVASVVVLTSLGEAARRYVVAEFSSLGTNLVIVLPGRSETTGGSTAMFVSETARDLTIADAVAVGRNARVRHVAPIIVGEAAASVGAREREVAVIGTTADMLEIRHWTMAHGTFLPPVDPERASSVCVIGAKVRRELFATAAVLGRWIRLGQRRCRVIGVLATEGRSIGLDVEELVLIPVASARTLFDTQALFRILVEARTRDAIPRVKQHIRAVIRDRHQGEDDVTIITQDAVLATFDRVLRTLTLAVAGIAGVSLAVAGILTMNVMLVAVSQRTAEIGLLKALGSPRRQIEILFLSEAALLSLAGAACGLVVGQSGSFLIGRLYPALPVGAPAWAVLTSVGVAVVAGLVFGAMPARRAAYLDPVDALGKR